MWSDLLSDPDQYTESDESQQETGLLVALLLKFPEIGAVKLSPRHETFRLTFLMKKTPRQEVVNDFETRMNKALLVLKDLSPNHTAGSTDQTKADPVPATIAIESYRDVVLFHISCHLRTVQFEDLQVILSLFQDAFSDLVIVDPTGEHYMDDEGHEMYIAHTFGRLRAVHHETLIGFRDGDRVLVFNEP